MFKLYLYWSQVIKFTSASCTSDCQHTTDSVVAKASEIKDNRQRRPGDKSSCDETDRVSIKLTNEVS